MLYLPACAILIAKESNVMHPLRGQLGLDPSPTVSVGSRLEEAVQDEEELDELCRICLGRPFLLSVRVRTAVFTGIYLTNEKLELQLLIGITQHCTMDLFWKTFFFYRICCSSC